MFDGNCFSRSMKTRAIAASIRFRLQWTCRAPPQPWYSCRVEDFIMQS
jgi:hypothetical protein